MPSASSENRRTEGSRFLVELAVNSGRSRIRPQTGYVHLCYHAHPGEAQETIPLRENFLFALALLRSKTSDHVMEARGMLERLLHFQTEGGGFPLYLHQYPQVYDHLIGGELLPIFYWILAPFHTVLGQALRDSLEAASQRLLEQGLERAEVLEHLPPVALKLAASAVALGRHLNRADWCSRGEALLQKWRPDEAIAHFQPESLGSILVAQQLLDPQMNSPESRDLLHQIQPLWDPVRCVYAGPALGEFYLGAQAEPTLFDLFMSCFLGEYGQRVMEDHEVHLHGALIHPMSREAMEPFTGSLAGLVEGVPWFHAQRDLYSYSLLAQSGEAGQRWPHHASVLRVCWGSRERVHSASLQVDPELPVTWEEKGDELELTLDLPEAENTGKREKNREFQFFVDVHSELEWTVEGKAANTFQLGEKVAWSSEGFKGTLCCELEQGSGKFFGHVMMGNRAGQKLCKGSYRYDAHDWVVFVRRVDSRGPCVLKLRFSMGEG